ncbi:hypothetical protein CapIbe_003472 [Capra ibex]
MSTEDFTQSYFLMLLPIRTISDRDLNHCQGAKPWSLSDVVRSGCRSWTLQGAPSSSLPAGTGAVGGKDVGYGKKQSNCVENVEDEKIADGFDGPQVSLRAGVPGASGVAFHVEGVSFERDDQQGGRQHKHDQRDEDPQVKGGNQVAVGLGEVHLLSGVGRGDGDGIVHVHIEDASREGEAGAKGEEQGQPHKPRHQSHDLPLHHGEPRMTQNSRQYVFSSIIQICSKSLEKLSMSRMQSPMGSLSPLTHSAPWLMVMKSFPAMPMMHAIAETTKGPGMGERGLGMSQYSPGGMHRPRWRVALVFVAGYSRAGVFTFWSTFQL